MRDWVAVILAAGLSLAVIMFAAAALWATIAGRPLGENSSQVLVAAVGGLTGILGGFLGYRAGRTHNQPKEPE